MHNFPAVGVLLNFTISGKSKFRESYIGDPTHSIIDACGTPKAGHNCDCGTPKYKPI
jgi:hypothetical protein